MHHVCSQADLEVLCGPDISYPYRDLYQEGEFAAKEVVALVGPKMRLENVEFSARNAQVEVSGLMPFVGIQSTGGHRGSSWF